MPRLIVRGCATTVFLLFSFFLLGSPAPTLPLRHTLSPAFSATLPCTAHGGSRQSRTDTRHSTGITSFRHQKNNVHKQFTHMGSSFTFSLSPFFFLKTAGHKPNSFIQYAASAKRCKHPIYFPCVLHKQNLASCLVARSLPALAHRPFLN